MIRPLRFIATLLGLSILATVFPGCVKERRGVGDAPKDTEPVRIILGVQARLVDYDGDVYPDTAIASVYIMGNWPQSLAPPGAEAMFALYSAEDELLGEWTFGAQETRAALRDGVVGPGYFFPLKITDFIDDKMPETTLKIDATFTLKDGRTLRAPGKKEKLFGRIGG